MIIKAAKTYIVQSFGMVGNMVSEFFDHYVLCLKSFIVLTKLKQWYFVFAYVFMIQRGRICKYLLAINWNDDRQKRAYEQCR